MATELKKVVKILLTPEEKSTGCTFSKVNPEASLEDLYKLGRGINAFKAKSYTDIYRIVATNYLAE